MTVIYHTLFLDLPWGGMENAAMVVESRLHGYRKKKERQSLIKNMKPTVSEFPECFFEIDDVF